MEVDVFEVDFVDFLNDFEVAAVVGESSSVLIVDSDVSAMDSWSLDASSASVVSSPSDVTCEKY